MRAAQLLMFGTSLRILPNSRDDWTSFSALLPPSLSFFFIEQICFALPPLPSSSPPASHSPAVAPSLTSDTLPPPPPPTLQPNVKTHFTALLRNVSVFLQQLKLCICAVSTSFHNQICFTAKKSHCSFRFYDHLVSLQPHRAQSDHLRLSVVNLFLGTRD